MHERRRENGSGYVLPIALSVKSHAVGKGHHTSASQVWRSLGDLNHAGFEIAGGAGARDEQSEYE